MIAQFELKFDGNEADDSVIDMYDVATALYGFQRSLALTTHLVLNGEVITQATSLKGARVLAPTFEEGSWKALALVSAIGTAGFKLGTAPKDTPIGHLVRSAYSYVMAESVGITVDYDKTIGEQLEEQKIAQASITKSKLDSLIEKCENPVLDMHRPIVYSKTANSAMLSTQSEFHSTLPIQKLDTKTYAIIKQEKRAKSPEFIEGQVSSFNVNTYKGRIYIPEEKRTISFKLDKIAHTIRNRSLLADSLRRNAGRNDRFVDLIALYVFKNYYPSGRLKSLLAIGVYESLGDVVDDDILE